jgi:uncharacterized membrane protein YphA (DoxX/SURF4 family)
MTTFGRRVYGLGAVGLGIVELAYGAISADWLPVSPHMPGYHLLAYASAAVLVLAGLAMQWPRTAAIGALVLAAGFAAGMAVFELPHTVTKPADWGGWQAIAESVAMALGGVLAFTQTPGVGESRAANLARIARWGFGVCLLIFGGSHFVYAKYTAALVPAWLPPSQIFWTYVTGAAQIAAGLAMLSGVQARLAAVLLTVMYSAFSVLVHIPSVIAAPSSHANWAENGINLVLIGAAWTLADSLSRMRR